MRFGIKDTVQKYVGLIYPLDHVAQCITTWSIMSMEEWAHWFIHMLDTIPKNWYIELEMRRGIADWEEMVSNFKVTFIFSR